MHGPWVFGALINNVWSFAGGSDRRDVNQMLIQPFINYNLPDAWYVGSSPIITANWEADSDNQWTVPLGVSEGKIVRLGKLPVNTQVGGGALEHSAAEEEPETVNRMLLEFLAACESPGSLAVAGAPERIRRRGCPASVE